MKLGRGGSRSAIFSPRQQEHGLFTPFMSVRGALVRPSSHSSSITFETTKPPELAFRALLTEGGAERLQVTKAKRKELRCARHPWPRAARSLRSRWRL
jgi:hypothetical protein